MYEALPADDIDLLVDVLFLLAKYGMVIWCHFSVLDYLGLLDFGNNKNIREWYQKVKSRPSFKNLLKDQIVGLSPHENYKSIDI